MNKKILLSVVTFFTSLFFNTAVSAQYGKYIAINGVTLTQSEIVTLENQLGFFLPPGNYFTDGVCIIHIESGSNSCSNNNQPVVNPQPSNPNNDGGLILNDFGSVGDGCVYFPETGDSVCN